MKHYLLACLLFCSVAFAESSTPRPKLQIINGGNQPIDIYWLKSENERVPNGTVQPGRYSIITTTIGHRFAVVTKDETESLIVKSEMLVQAVRFEPKKPDGVPAFYTQKIEANGYPIVASANVNPYALREAAYLVDQMLAKREDVRQAMIKSGSRLCILAHHEFTTDQPEFANLDQVPGFESLTAKEYWDARARGLGGSETDALCSCAEENLLAYDGDPYESENILIHEFAHNIHLRGMANVDPTFDTRLKAAFEAAIASGLWNGTYASTNHSEYFAEGTQCWFDNNRENDAQHNHVNTREELHAYDPKLAALCAEVFGDTFFKYTKPRVRLTDHLLGYDPSNSPSFVWPDRLMKARGLIKSNQLARFHEAVGVQEYDKRTIAGWDVHIRSRLIEQDAPTVEKAMQLLRAQLDEIVRVVPPAAVAELKKVPLYFSPEYPGVPPRAEYHPGQRWLEENGRDPAMAKGVEFTNVRTFEQETNRMPNFTLHELSHAYHDRVLSGGFANEELKNAYENAKKSGKYDRVERWFGNGKPSSFEESYAMKNPMEYFAESSEAYFCRNDFFPFVKEELKRHDSEMFKLLEKIWH